VRWGVVAASPWCPFPINSRDQQQRIREMADRGSDADLFKGMTRRELDQLANRVGHAAQGQADRGEYDTARELNQVWLDLDVAWWQKFRQGER
jgi:hypothetical protein